MIEHACFHMMWGCLNHPWDYTHYNAKGEIVALWTENLDLAQSAPQKMLI